jgi:hypothetical protein
MGLSYMIVAGGDPCQAEFSKADIPLVSLSLAFNDSVLVHCVRRGPTYWMVRCPPLQIDLRQ